VVDPAFAALGELAPEVTEETAPFWDGLAAGELRMEHCPACGSYQHPAESFCYACGSLSVTWETVRGHGEVYSFIVVHQPYHAAFRDRLPYVVATVQLDEGPRMLGPIFDIDPSAVWIGMRVQPRIEAVSAERSALFFEPEQTGLRPDPSEDAAPAGGSVSAS
jgi:hypothetical protein